MDYLATFPISGNRLPSLFRKLLEPVGNSPDQTVEVTLVRDFDRNGPCREYAHMLMAVVPDDECNIPRFLSESRLGVVSFGPTAARRKGDARSFTPSVSGYDYIVASWSDGAAFAYNLSEKVWMALGLSPRCIGNDTQQIIYDDLSLPQFSVAEGEVSTQFYWSSKRNISWKMYNEYLRKYLWMRGAYGVRIFFYEALVEDSPELRGLMNGKGHVLLEPEGSWYELDIREHQESLLIQVWATVKAIPPELCPEPSASGIVWPGINGLMTQARADSPVPHMTVFLDDMFLKRYEESNFYSTTPVNSHGSWGCNPSYQGRWSFTDCVRVGRNLIRTSVRELYKPKPQREILHAHRFALAPDRIAQFDLKEEHIVAKTQRLLDQLLELGDNLSKLAASIGICKPAMEIVPFSRAKVHANGWSSYPQLSRLAQVAPLDMSQQAFLSRCKSLHEIWQGIPDGFLKRLLEAAGCPSKCIKPLGSLKLLQALLNIIIRLNVAQETVHAFKGSKEPEAWRDRNAAMAPLFLNYELRIADAHETTERFLQMLEVLGFDTANLNQGYGCALDFMMDSVAGAFAIINREIARIIER